MKNKNKFNKKIFIIIISVFLTSLVIWFASAIWFLGAMGEKKKTFHVIIVFGSPFFFIFIFYFFKIIFQQFKKRLSY
jgi:hypothetical protein